MDGEGEIWGMALILSAVVAHSNLKRRQVREGSGTGVQHATFPKKQLGTGTEAQRCPIVLFPPEQVFGIEIATAKGKQNRAKFDGRMTKFE